MIHKIVSNLPFKGFYFSNYNLFFRKVSIAENLNCDYWDWEYSEVCPYFPDNPIFLKKTFTVGRDWDGRSPGGAGGEHQEHIKISHQLLLLLLLHLSLHLSRHLSPWAHCHSHLRPRLLHCILPETSCCDIFVIGDRLSNIHCFIIILNVGLYVHFHGELWKVFFFSHCCFSSINFWQL